MTKLQAVAAADKKDYNLLLFLLLFVASLSSLLLNYCYQSLYQYHRYKGLIRYSAVHGEICGFASLMRFRSPIFPTVTLIGGLVVVVGGGGCGGYYQ